MGSVAVALHAIIVDGTAHWRHITRRRRRRWGRLIIDMLVMLRSTQQHFLSLLLSQGLGPAQVVSADDVGVVSRNDDTVWPRHRVRRRDALVHRRRQPVQKRG